MKAYSKYDILNSYDWIKIKKYEDDAKLSDADRLAQLQMHHETETNFLIQFIRDLVVGKVIINE